MSHDINESIKEVCLLNDSFPPLIDGVANAVVNYARILKEDGYDVTVVTPECPGADDSCFDYPVIRYPSIDTRKYIGYPAGMPMDMPTCLKLKHSDISILHSHCPAASNLMGRILRKSLNVPLVMTYHTKYDIDISNAVRGKLIQEGAIQALVDSVSACDELWVVSDGAGKNIQSLGYKGDYIVMENGVDIPRCRPSDAQITMVTSAYSLPESTPVFLFVGRLMWYKGLRIILDALAALKSQDLDFRMVFVGSGGDEEEVRAYAKQLKINDKTLFIGAVRDRNTLSAWYGRADLMLFPSSFDTNGLVVREAAACSLASVLIAGSCASEGVTQNVNGLLIEESAASLAVCLSRIMDNRDAMRSIGENAARDLYISWDSSVRKAIDRYGTIIENYRSGKYKKRHKLSDQFVSFSGDMVSLFDKADQERRKIDSLLEHYL